ncbi:MAG: hypothetical protein IKU70_09435 [Clostridia bacterium]|nr:hypothetical protein [Clostridia bacterium]
MINKFKNNRGMTVNVICAVLMAILLVLQFVPFWHYGEAGESCSISGYIWFPSDHKELESWLISQAEDHDLNSFVGMPILVLVLSVVGSIFCLLKADQNWVGLFPLACGAAGAVAYLTIPALRLGVGWTWHLLLCIVLAVLGGYGLMQQVKEMKSV